MAAPFTERNYIPTLIFVTSLFMFWGIALTMGDVLNKDFQNVLGLTKAQSGLIQFSMYGAYAIMGIPAGLFVSRFGYKRGVQLGLTLFALGAFLFVPSTNMASFPFFRFALFVLACGMATLETTAHPFMAAMGDQRTSDLRINFAQFFNAVGTIIGPIIGGYFIFRLTKEYGTGLLPVKDLYIGIGISIVLVLVAFSMIRVPRLQDVHVATETTVGFKPTKKLWQHRHFIWAVIAQFFDVAAQGGTWAFFINYAVEKMHFTDEVAARYLSLSMFGMMLGRFIGTILMRFVAPNKVLAGAAVCNILMCLIVAQSWGWVSFVALLFINFFFSIMFPTIFSLGLKNLGKLIPRASSFIVIGVGGGAIFPILMGYVGKNDISTAYYLPIICYVVIFLFGYKFYKTSEA